MGVSEVSYLGHRVGNVLVSPEPSKVETIKSWPVSKRTKKVQSFIGLANYYRRFVKRFSNIVAPITDFTKKGRLEKVIWTKACENGFQSIKEALSKQLVLTSPYFEEPFLLYTDASSTFRFYSFLHIHNPLSSSTS